MALCLQPSHHLSKGLRKLTSWALFLRKFLKDIFQPHRSKSKGKVEAWGKNGSSLELCDRPGGHSRSECERVPRRYDSKLVEGIQF
jgi:hypothetical protein